MAALHRSEMLSSGTHNTNLIFRRGIPLSLRFWQVMGPLHVMRRKCHWQNISYWF